MNDLTSSFLTLFIGALIGAFIVYFILKVMEIKALTKADKIINEAKKDADLYKRDSLKELKEETFKLKKESQDEIREKKEEALRSEERLMNREKSLDKREEMLQNRDNLLEQKDSNLTNLQKDIQQKELKLEKLTDEKIKKLEEISFLSEDDAKKMILDEVKESMSLELAAYVKEAEAEAKLEVTQKAKHLLVTSMEKYANDVTTIQTVSTINLPSDDMKGRLIGRDGRNIRTIEAVTGVDLIIDDTPEAIVISSFDPYRREIAKNAIETLVKDGRIHPTRIEEIYDKVQKDMESRVTEIGNEAIYELGISKIDPKLVYYIGKLKFRSSYGQNALTHSKEVAHLSGIMAAEIGENINLAKRAGLLHDIGKAVDSEMEGSHVDIGINLAKKHGEHGVILNSIASHHKDTEATSIISELVSIADAISASRPGARNDTMENYIKRLEELEALGNDFDGVEKTYAMQAGREVRVIVKPDEIDDLKAYKIARKLKEKIESELQYPGTIKIAVIRETRAHTEAK